MMLGRIEMPASEASRPHIGTSPRVGANTLMARMHGEPLPLASDGEAGAAPFHGYQIDEYGNLFLIRRENTCATGSNPGKGAVG